MGPCDTPTIISWRVWSGVGKGGGSRARECFSVLHEKVCLGAQENGLAQPQLPCLEVARVRKVRLAHWTLVVLVEMRHGTLLTERMQRRKEVWSIDVGWGEVWSARQRGQEQNKPTRRCDDTMSETSSPARCPSMLWERAGKYSARWQTQNARSVEERRGTNRRRAHTVAPLRKSIIGILRRHVDFS